MCFILSSFFLSFFLFFFSSSSFFREIGGCEFRSMENEGRRPRSIFQKKNFVNLGWKDPKEDRYFIAMEKIYISERKSSICLPNKLRSSLFYIYAGNNNKRRRKKSMYRIVLPSIFLDNFSNQLFLTTFDSILNSCCGPVSSNLISARIAQESYPLFFERFKIDYRSNSSNFSTR